MNYALIRKCDIANGEGVRVSLFVSGCTHRCKGCFNAEAQDFAYGKPFTREVEDEILEALAPHYIAGLTLLGGEPMEPVNQRALAPFIERFREKDGREQFLLYLKPIINRTGNYYIEAQTRDQKRTDVIIDYMGKQYNRAQNLAWGKI